MFPGQYYDQETGLHYNYFRYYDPSTGRYLTSDPIGQDGGTNTFLYGDGNPVTKIDPLGLLAGAGAAGGATGLPGLGGFGGGRDRNTNAPFWPKPIQDFLDSQRYYNDGIPPWRDDERDHPSHADEEAALNTTGADSCENIAWAIGVLRAGIAWRKGDLRPEDANNLIGRGHRQRIKRMQDHLKNLESAYNSKCRLSCNTF